MEYGDGLTAERREEIAKGLGLSGVPRPRYDDLPAAMDPLEAEMRANHKKALACIDAIASHAFMRYLPNNLVVDQTLDARVFKKEYSFGASVRTDRGIPVNPKITAATGITAYPCEKNWYNLLAQGVMRYYQFYLAIAISPCLIFRTRGEKSRMGRRYGTRFNIAPMVGVIFKLDRRRRDGALLAESVAMTGIIHDKSVESTNVVHPVPIEGGIVGPDGKPLAIN
jgi:hypothetical protein